MAHYLFNLVTGDAADGSDLHDLAAGFLDSGWWEVEADERHGDALAPGDLVLIYLGAP